MVPAIACRRKYILRRLRVASPVLSSITKLPSPSPATWRDMAVVALTVAAAEDTRLSGDVKFIFETNQLLRAGRYFISMNHALIFLAPQPFQNSSMSLSSSLSRGSVAQPVVAVSETSSQGPITAPDSPERSGPETWGESPRGSGVVIEPGVENPGDVVSKVVP